MYSACNLAKSIVRITANAKTFCSLLVRSFACTAGFGVNECDCVDERDSVIALFHFPLFGLVCPRRTDNSDNAIL